jgi:GT2 family glycosyltransferase
MKKFTLDIVILSYNGSFWLKKTLTSLTQFYLKKTQHKVKVWLVDNASTDDSVAMVKENFSFVKIIVSAKNIGFAAGNNLALKKITSDYIMLLNPDTELDQHSQIDLLLAYLDAHKDVGMIGPKLLLTDGRLDMASHRGEPTLWASFCYLFGLEKLFPRVRLFNSYHRFDLDLTTIHEVEAISGAAMVVSAQAFKKVGLLDEQFFLYAEDLDWAKRFREAGYKVVYDPEVVITHHKNKSGIANQDAQIKGKARTYFYQTMLQYYDKHYGHKYPKFLRVLVHTLLFIKKEGWSS